MAVSKVVTEKIKAKEGRVELEMIKDIEKNKENFSMFTLKIAEQMLSLDDKDAKSIIKLFKKVFREKKEQTTMPQPVQQILPPAQVEAAQKIAATETTVAKIEVAGKTMTNNDSINKMTMDSLRARSGQRKKSNPMVDKINNREDDRYVDKAFQDGMRSIRGSRNSVVNQINNHGSL